MNWSHCPKKTGMCVRLTPVGVSNNTGINRLPQLVHESWVQGYLSCFQYHLTASIVILYIILSII